VVHSSPLSTIPSRNAATNSQTKRCGHVHNLHRFRTDHNGTYGRRVVTVGGQALSRLAEWSSTVSLRVLDADDVRGVGDGPH
jgi:hypothetical protein